MRTDEEPILFFNVLFSFAAFLLCFGNACYEYGLNAGHSDGLWPIILFPLWYFAVFIAAIAVFYKKFSSAKPFIAMGVISIAFIALCWIVFCVEEATATASSLVLWFPITLTVLSVIISVLYFLQTYQFYRDRK